MGKERKGVRERYQDRGSEIKTTMGTGVEHKNWTFKNIFIKFAERVDVEGMGEGV